MITVKDIPMYMKAIPGTIFSATDPILFIPPIGPKLSALPTVEPVILPRHESIVEPLCYCISLTVFPIPKAATVPDIAKVTARKAHRELSPFLM